MAQRPDASKQYHWLKLIRLWQRQPSSVTIREFCRLRGLSVPSFYAWRRVLRQRGLIHDQRTPQATIPADDTPSIPAFVNLAMDTEPPAATAVDLVLSDRRLLRVRPGFDPDSLLALVRLLEEPTC